MDFEWCEKEFGVVVRDFGRIEEGCLGFMCWLICPKRFARFHLGHFFGLGDMEVGQ